MKLSDHLDSGDKIHLAWIESGNCCDAAFTIDTLGSESGLAGMALSNDERYGYLVDSPCGHLGFVDQSADRQLARPVLGAAAYSQGLPWDIVLTMIERGYSPTEGLDLAALGFGWSFDTAGYISARNMSPTTLRTRVDTVIDQLEAPCPVWPGGDQRA